MAHRSTDLNDGGSDWEGDGGCDQPMRIEFVGARGGQGTSTVAAAAALLLGEIHGRVRLDAGDPAAVAALLGAVCQVDGPTRLTPSVELARLDSRSAAGCSAIVADVGCLASTAFTPEGAVTDRRVGVLRGPCYVALRTLAAADRIPLAGLVLCWEAGRSLDRRDVEDIVGLPVLATVDVTPAVARTLDAGLGVARLARMREFAQVRRWLARLVSGPQHAPDRRAPEAVAFRAEPVETTCTDWHLPPGAEGADRGGAVDVPCPVHDERPFAHLETDVAGGVHGAGGGRHVLEELSRSRSGRWSLSVGDGSARTLMYQALPHNDQRVAAASA